jgi:cell division protease FtsH
VDRPDKQGREEILTVHLKNIKLEDDLDLGQLAALKRFMNAPAPESP